MTPAVAPDATPIRVLLADDHPVVRRGLAALLGTLDGIEVVAHAGTGDEAVREVGLAGPMSSSWTCACPAWTGWRPRAAS